MAKNYLELTDRALLAEIEQKRKVLILEPEYGFALRKSIDSSLKYLSDLYSWWQQNPDARAYMEEELKAHSPRDVKMLSRDHAEKIGNAWSFLRGAVEYSRKPTQKLLSPRLIQQLAEIIDPLNNRYRVFNEKAESFEPDYQPPHAAQVQPLVEKLCDKVNNSSAHPVDLAAYTHLTIVGIQPFLAAHKRLGRILQDSILVDNHLPPATILPGERKTYYDFLRNALVDEAKGRSNAQSSFFNYIGGKINVKLDNLIYTIFTDQGRELPEEKRTNKKETHKERRHGHSPHGARFKKQRK